MDPIASLKLALAGRYEIEREIGRGGMATVYLARDMRHARHVALKVLSPELGAVLGAERFLGEIRVTANLQHPNLLPLFDSGEAGGLLFYVMPFVDGETLRARLEREKQLPIDDAVRIAVAIASALAYAHEHGVIHRDLKPENILIQAGQPVIADFGIALAVSNAGGTRVTQTGLSLGTPQYMSPEQAAGDRAIDGRSDIYSLGAVTYEMLAGEPPHSGTSAQAIIAKLMTSEPQPLRALRKAVPNSVSDAVGKALEKSPADRFTTASEFAAALVNPAFTTAREHDRIGSARAGGWMSRAAVAAVASVVGAAVGIALWSALHHAAPESRSVSRVQVYAHSGEEIVPPVQGPSLVISPDGSILVYAGRSGTGGWQLWRRPMNALAATPIPGTDAAVLPAFSPDGREIAFGSMKDRKIRTISVTSGTATVVADSARRGGLHWGSDGRLYFRSTSNGISRVLARGGAVEPVTTTNVRGNGIGHFWPELVSDDVLLYIDRPTLGLADGKVMARRIGSKEATVLAAAVYARFAAPGYLVWATADRTVLAATFNPRTFALGTPVPVLDKVRVESFLGSADFTFSAAGRLLYQQGDVSQEDLVWVTRAGVASKPIEVTGLHTSGTGSFALSPDGQRAAISRTIESGSDIWIKHLPDGPLDRLTFEGSPNYSPAWTPDGRFVSFSTVRTTARSLFLRPADGTGRDSALFTMPGGVEQGAWSPDGRWIVVSSADNHQIVALRPGVDSSRHVIVVAEKSFLGFPQVSPDGRWLSYVSNETGDYEVYVRPFPDAGGGKWMISSNGGDLAQWSRGGHELFYLTPNRALMSATYRSAPAFSVERRDVVLSDSTALAQGLTGRFAVSPDGKRFLFSRARNQGLALVLVENWFEELKGKVR